MESPRSLRVGIDATPMLVAQRTGIERYATALVRELAALLPKLDDVRLTVYLHAANPYASPAHLDQTLEMLTSAGVPHRVYTLRRGYGGMLSVYAAQDRLDVLHMLSHARSWARNCPYLLTIYDVKSVGLSDEGQRIERAAMSERERRVILGAAGLITISQSTANDLRSEFGAGLRMPMRAIHLGVDAVFFAGHEQAEAMRRKYGLERYIFFVGNLQYRKNLPRLVEAFARVKHGHGIPHKLVLAGRNGWGAELVYQAVHDYGVADTVLCLGYIPESDLPGLYAGADLFTYPSLHEGFGIPLLEAMAAGTVVYASSLFSIPEVAGDAALYVDPYDVNKMADELWHGISDETLRQDLIRKGRARAKQFTWQQMARQTTDFYRALRPAIKRV